MARLALIVELEVILSYQINGTSLTEYVLMPFDRFPTY